MTLGCLVNQEETHSALFRSATTLLDYDVAVWDPASTISEYRRDILSGEFRGLPSLSEGDSVRIVDDIARRNREFAAMLELGRTLVVFASPPQRCYVYTGQSTTSGTGRNAKVTNTVDTKDVLACLPFKMTSVEAAGTQMELRGREPFGEF